MNSTKEIQAYGAAAHLSAHLQDEAAVADALRNPEVFMASLRERRLAAARRILELDPSNVEANLEYLAIQEQDGEAKQARVKSLAREAVRVCGLDYDADPEENWD